VRYAIAGSGLGLLAGSLLWHFGNIAPRQWAGLTVAPISFLGFLAGLCFCAIALQSVSLSDKDWPSRRRLLTARILRKASEDPEFREELKADWRQIIGREFDLTFPDDFEITVLEEAPQHLYLVLLPAGTASRSAWTERSNDGRIRYALAGFGLGLVVGSVVSIISDNTPLFNWTGVGYGPLSVLGVVGGLCLFTITLFPQSSTGQDWSWKRHNRTALEHLITRADKDLEFRQQLKADWRRTFEHEFGSKITISDDSEITVLEETPTQEYIVLPTLNRSTSCQ
jgi:hypothetical protein